MALDKRIERYNSILQRRAGSTPLFIVVEHFPGPGGPVDDDQLVLQTLHHSLPSISTHFLPTLIRCLVCAPPISSQSSCEVIRSPSHSGLRTSFDCRSTIRVGLPTGKGSTLPWGGGVLVAGPHSQECWRTRVVPAVLTGRSMLPPLLSVRFVVVTFFCRLPGSRS